MALRDLHRGARTVMTEQSPSSPEPRIVKHHFDSGRVCCETPYVGDSLEGEGRMYYTTGALYAVEHYAGGVLNGPTVTYYLNGVVQSELSYTDALLDGVVREFFPSGKLESEVRYRAGKRHGPTVVYDEAGLVTRRDWYADDDLVKTEPGPGPLDPLDPSPLPSPEETP